MSAEKGAYLAASAAPLPTLFEVLAASNLSDLLKPIVGHLTDCLVSWKPEWHRLLVPARKIAWILAILGVDGYHLKHYGTFDFVFVDSWDACSSLNCLSSIIENITPTFSGCSYLIYGPTFDALYLNFAESLCSLF